MAGDLEALASARSPANWRRLCEALDRLPPEDVAAACKRLEPLLAAWPDDERVTMCKLDWDEDVFAGRRQPRMAVVRHFRYDRTFIGRGGGFMIRSYSVGTPAVRALAAHAGAAHLTRLNLGGHDLVEASFELLAASPELRGLGALVLSDAQPGARGLEALALATFAPGLRELDVSSCAADGEAIEGLTAVGFPRLTKLDLSSNPLGTRGARALAGASPVLEELAVGSASLGAPGAKALAGALGALASLVITDNGLGDDGVAALASGSLVARDLTISNNRLGRAGLAALLDEGFASEALDATENMLDDAAAELLADAAADTLVRLRLDDNDVGPAGLEALLASPALERLEELSVVSNRLGPKTAFGPNTRSLRVLRLSGNRLGDDGVIALAGAARVLARLELRGNELGARGLEALSGAPWFGALEHLDLSDNPLGPIAGSLLERAGASRLVLARTGLGAEGAIAFAAGSARPTSLSLSGCAIGDAGLAALAASPVLSAVTELELRGNGISATAALALARSPHVGALASIALDPEASSDAVVIALVARGVAQIDVGSAKLGAAAKAALDGLPPTCCP